MPAVYVRLLELDADLARDVGADARLFVSGSAPLPAHVHAAFAERYGHRILERYGMSETLMTIGNPYAGERRAGSVGFPFPGTAVRILDPQGGPVADDETGELWVRGPTVCAGYWNRPDATAAAFVDGWFRTGDLGARSADGYVTLRGRGTDLIISSGFNIYPREIEDVLLELPGVREAVVVGAPHPAQGRGAARLRRRRRPVRSRRDPRRVRVGAGVVQGARRRRARGRAAAHRARQGAEAPAARVDDAGTRRVTGAGWALAALLGAIVLSLTSRVNVGIVAIALAWLAGTLGAHLGTEAILGGFPGSLFVTLLGVTLLFAVAESNGTLATLAQRVVWLARGDARVLPWLLFAAAALLSSMGPGAVPTVALLAPLAMAAGMRAGVSPFLTALMVCNGANAGNLSPVSAVGVVANGILVKAQLGGHAVRFWLANAAAHAVVALLAYLALQWRGRARAEASGDVVAPVALRDVPPALSRVEWITLGVIATWVVGLLVWKWPLGPTACAAAALLIAGRAADEGATFRRVPWSAITMVTGVSLLVALLEKTGGMPLFASLLARLATPATLDGTIAFVTGAISGWSSTSGVVIPAFLPTAPALVAQTGGGDPLAVALSIAVGSHLVDVSPLSTLGALCIATLADPAKQRTLFRQLMTWGLGMILGGALLCQLAAGWVARL